MGHSRGKIDRERGGGRLYDTVDYFHKVPVTSHYELQRESQLLPRQVVCILHVRKLANRVLVTATIQMNRPSDSWLCNVTLRSSCGGHVITAASSPFLSDYRSVTYVHMTSQLSRRQARLADQTRGTFTKYLFIVHQLVH